MTHFTFFYVFCQFFSFQLMLAPAAWRSGGLHYRLCGLQTFIFALPFLRTYCRRCAKPPVGCQCIFPIFFHNFIHQKLFFPLIVLLLCSFSFAGIPLVCRLSFCYKRRTTTDNFRNNRRRPLILE